jgi:hypothetical protein
MPMIPKADNLRELMRAMYPDVDDGSEHPMTGVGVVLLAAGLFGITDEDALVAFTGYPKAFIFAIRFNLRKNGVWDNGSYDSSGWLSCGSVIDGQTLWSHVDAACGMIVLRDFDGPVLDPCEIYWKSRESLNSPSKLPPLQFRPFHSNS